MQKPASSFLPLSLVVAGGVLVAVAALAYAGFRRPAIAIEQTGYSSDGEVQYVMAALRLSNNSGKPFKFWGYGSSNNPSPVLHYRKRNETSRKTTEPEVCLTGLRIFTLMPGQSVNFLAAVEVKSGSAWQMGIRDSSLIPLEQRLPKHAPPWIRRLARRCQSDGVWWGPVLPPLAPAEVAMIQSKGPK